MHNLALWIHIACGTVGLIIGPVTMLVRKRPTRRGAQHWHRLLGLVFHACVTGLCVTSLVLVALKPQLWWLGLIGLATQAAGYVGWVTRPSRRPQSLGSHVSAMCGAYISFVTAFLVVNLGAWYWWILPTLIGSPLIALTRIRLARGERVPVAG